MSNFLTPIFTRYALRYLLLFFGFLRLHSAVYSQCTLSCSQNLNVSLDPFGEAYIAPLMIAPNAANTCPGNLEVQLFSQVGQPLENPLTCSHLGVTITARVKHTASGNFCNGTLKVFDGLAPVMTCPQKFIFCSQDPSPANVGMPTMADNCTDSSALDYYHIDNGFTYPCGTMINGVPVLRRIDRTWTATDNSNNTATCLQKIYLKHITMADIVFPPSRDGIVQPSLSCGQSPYDLALTGQPTIQGLPVGASPLCEFAVTHADQVIQICPPAGFSVLRTWTAIDFCTNAIMTKVQIIKVEDKIAPVLTPLADITVGTTGFNCSAVVTLPTPLVTDNCSAVSTTASWQFGIGLGPFVNVPTGDHVVTYTATDACSNTSIATTMVTVADFTAPQAICGGNIQISVGTNGLGYINANTIDGGSFDDCGPVFLSISRNGTDFYPQAQVSCADINTPVLLTLRVLDASELDNYCDVVVTVRDFMKPNLTCPTNLNLTCLQNHEDLVLTGQATATDNCAMQGLTFSDNVSLNGCQVGVVNRTWLARDSSGNTKSCVQQINKTVLSTLSVVFPTPYNVLLCTSNASTLPSNTGSPTVTGVSCFQPNITYIDEIFITSLPPTYCYRILRHWKVIDFCVYDVNGGTAGIWEYTQTINVADNEVPIIDIQASVTVEATLPNCMASVVLPNATAIDCTDVILSHNSTYATQSGNNASGNYPMGIHQVVFTATDDCGNVSQKTLTINVIDQLKPVLSCPNIDTVSLSAEGSVTMSLALFSISATDNCSPASLLQYTMAPTVFTCTDLGYNIISATVTDEAGNTDNCSISVLITDNLNACFVNVTHVISGDIKNELGVGLSHIPVRLTGIDFSAETNCDTFGTYRFEDIPGGLVYSIRPYNNNNWLNGVTTFDLVLMSKHILGIDTIDSPYRLIAADANHSGSVTTFDIVTIRKVILGINDTFANNTAWRFIDQDFVFPDPLNPFGTTFPEQVTLPVLNADQPGHNFVGVKIGDINLSHNPAEARSYMDTMAMLMPDTFLKAGQVYDIPLKIENWSNLEGLQFELTCAQDQIHLNGIRSESPELINNGHYALHNNQLTVSWNRSNTTDDTTSKSDVLLILSFKANQDGRLQDMIALNPYRLEPEAYSSKAEQQILKLYFGKKPLINSQQHKILSCAPNPFSAQTDLLFQTAVDQAVTLTVRNMSGSVVLEQTAHYEAGRHRLTIDGALLPVSGMYCYTVCGAVGVIGLGRVVLQK